MQHNAAIRHKLFTIIPDLFLVSKCIPETLEHDVYKKTKVSMKELYW